MSIYEYAGINSITGHKSMHTHARIRGEQHMITRMASSVISCTRLANKLFGMAPHTIGAQEPFGYCDRLHIQEVPGKATSLECNESILEHRSIVDLLRCYDEQ